MMAFPGQYLLQHPVVGTPPVGPNIGDPSLNNAPLRFDKNKGKPPGDMSDYAEGSLEQMVLMQSMAGKEPPLDAMGGLPPGYNPVMMGSMDAYSTYGAASNYSGLPPPPPQGALGSGDPTGPQALIQAAGVAGMMGPKEVMSFAHFVLYPPNANAPPPTTRDRPPGCRTIFVGGLPENATEEHMKELFEGCGSIDSIRVSKKNFCHIRFQSEISVEKALYISGYRMKIENKDDKPNTGRLHVDYAQARDDLYEWECRQRALAREERHRTRVEQDMIRPSSPPPIVHYSDHEAALLVDKIKADDTFMQGTSVLIAWLERGDCNRRTCNTFYSMIQSVHSHVRRLLGEKQALDEELQGMKYNFQQRHEAILKQFEQIERIFGVSTKQKAWDHFSKAQRKNLDAWKKQTVEIRSMQQEEFLASRQEDEMDLSDDEDEPVQKRKREMDQSSESSQQSELEAMRVDSEKRKMIQRLQEALQGMQQQLINTRKELTRAEDSVAKLMREKTELMLQLSELKPTKQQQDKPDSAGNDEDDDDDVQIVTASDIVATTTKPSAALSRQPATSFSSELQQRDARLIGLISTFLHVHPFGASIDYIWSYLQRLKVFLRTSEIEDLLEKCTGVFKQETTGVGATIEKRWFFVGMDTEKHPFS